MEKQFASIKTELQILTASGIAQALRSMHNPSRSPTLTTSFLSTVTPQSLPAVTPQSLPAVTPQSLPAVTPQSLPAVTPQSLPAVTPQSLPAVTPQSLPAVTPQSLPVVTPQSLLDVTVVTSQCPLAMGTSQAGSTLTSQQTPVHQFQSMPNSSTDTNVPEPLEVCCMHVCCK